MAPIFALGKSRRIIRRHPAPCRQTTPTTWDSRRCCAEPKCFAKSTIMIRNQMDHSKRNLHLSVFRLLVVGLVVSIRAGPAPCIGQTILIDDFDDCNDEGWTRGQIGAVRTWDPSFMHDPDSSCGCRQRKAWSPCGRCLGWLGRPPSQKTDWHTELVNEKPSPLKAMTYSRESATSGN